MDKQIIFLVTLLVTLGVFGYTTRKFIGYFRQTQRGFPVKQLGRRFGVMMEVAIGQTKIFRRPVMGLLHALVFWGFCVILIGSIEMVIDGFLARKGCFPSLGDSIISSWLRAIFSPWSSPSPYLFSFPEGFS
jgi:phosphatidylglycerophosphate synthase